MSMYGKVNVMHQSHPLRSLKFYTAMRQLLLSKHKKYKFGDDPIATFCSGIDKLQRQKKRRDHFNNNIEHNIYEVHNITDLLEK